MFRLGLRQHPELCTDLTKFISALLPHERGDASYFNIILDQVTRLIHIDELEAEYFLVFSVAEQLAEIALNTQTRPIFLREILDSALDANIYNIIQKDGQGFAAMMAEEGCPNDFLIEQNIQNASAVAKNQAMDLYDEAFDMQVSPEEAVGFIISLKSNYSLAVGKEVIQAQSLLINGNEHFPNAHYEGWYRFLNKKKFVGSSGWVDFLNYISSSLSDRLIEADDESKPLTSIEDAEKLKQDVLDRTAPIAEYGIPPIDNQRPIMKTRYTVLVGKPNLGKTTIAVNWLVNVFLQNRKVAIFSEETPESCMLYEYVLPVYIYKKYGFFASYEQIIGLEEIGGIDNQEIEERKKMIKMSICDITESGNYLYISSLNAWNIKSDLAKIYKDFPFDYCVIDHSLSLAGGGDTTQRLNAMSMGIKQFKNDSKTSICLLSHPSPDAKKVVSRDGAAGLTSYSKHIEGDADEVFYMFDTPELEAKDLIGFIQTKGRGASKVLEVIFLTKIFEYKIFIYDAAVQKSSTDIDKTLSAIPIDDAEDEEEGDYEDF